MLNIFGSDLCSNCLQKFSEKVPLAGKEWMLIIRHEWVHFNHLLYLVKWSTVAKLVKR